MTTAPRPSRPPIVVIVAEDDPMVRMLAVDALTEAGCEVIEAIDADHALSILTAQARTVDALFTDINLPGELDGLLLANYVRDHWPWVALLLTSGRARPSLEEMPVGSWFLAKPYALHNVVRDVLELVSGVRPR